MVAAAACAALRVALRVALAAVDRLGTTHLMAAAWVAAAAVVGRSTRLLFRSHTDRMALCHAQSLLTLPTQAAGAAVG